MCFTVNLNLVKEELENRFGATFLDPDSYRPSYYYHAFGLPDLPAICSASPGNIRLLKWGLIPEWVRDEKSAEEIRIKTFNARSESVAEKASFSSSFREKRCIIPVSGFFEWQHRGKIKVPWYISRADGDIMSLAGLYSEWVSTVTGLTVPTFTIVTTDANPLMAEIHNSKKRMPLVLSADTEKLWIDTTLSEDKVSGLMIPCPDSSLHAYTVGPMIGNRNALKNRPELVLPFNWNAQDTLF